MDRFLTGFQNLVQAPEDIIFVDNGSKENLALAVAERFSKMTVLRLPENLMFCGGYNAGIRLAMERNYDFVLMSNADTEVVNSRFLEELVEAAQRWPRGAFFGPQVFWKNHGIGQKTCLQFPRFRRSLWQWVPWRLFRGYFERQPEKEGIVEFLNGVCVLCRVKALEEIGLMDDKMGGYVEDTDWSWRALQKGWASVFTPVPSIIHHEMSRGYEPYSLKTFLLKRNMVYWYLKIGRLQSARNYARTSLALARVRRFLAHTSDEEARHRYFGRRLKEAYRGLLHGDPLGEWFGPPLGRWENDGDS